MGDPREDSRSEEKEQVDLREEWVSLASDWLTHLFPKSAKLPSDDDAPERERAPARSRWSKH